jgi:parallel beta-helix repeat protein
MRRRDTMLLALLIVFLVAGGAVSLFFAAPRPIAPQTRHDPIRISGDAQFTAENGVVRGQGTPSDPYVIEDWVIVRDTGSFAAIVLDDTTAHVRIRRVVIRSQDGLGQNGECIALRRAANVRVENASLANCFEGLFISGGSSIAVANTSFSSIVYAAQILGGTDVVFEGNRMLDRFSGSLIVSQVTNLLVRGNSFEGQGAISMSGVNNGTVEQNSVAVEGIGITAWDSSAIRVRNNTVTHGVSSSAIAIRIHASNGTLVEDNVITTRTGKGLSVESSEGLRIARNRFTSSGITLSGALPAHFASHTISANNLANGRPIRYERMCADLVVDGEALGQLLVAGCTNVHASNLNLSDTENGLQLAFVTDARASGNTLWNNHDYSITLTNVADVHLSGTTIVNGEGGIRILSSANVTVSGTELDSIQFFDYALYADGSSVVNLTGNRIRGSENGIGIRQCSDVLIRGNLLVRTDGGVRIHSAWDALVTENGIADGEVGIVVGDDYEGLSGANVSVIHNDFVRNRVQASDRAQNVVAWDDGYPSSGNFWSDHVAIDVLRGPAQDQPGGDGIADTSYEAFESGRFDGYPRLDPFGWFDYPPSARMTVSSAQGSTSTIFQLNASRSWDLEDGVDLEVRWDWEGDSVWDTDWTTANTANHTYDEPQRYHAQVQVRDSIGQTAVASVELRVDSPFVPPQAPLDLPILAAVSVGIGLFGAVAIVFALKKRKDLRPPAEKP